ncbi:hypothetical protein M2475_000718 [Breznakia sp. PF5-3]|nr:MULTISPECIES: hypothetical protein [unclassified Breznakia]MDL2276124.1 hypothetical protein [Breznakia sp. OttesenSCG-928-G09]MDF9824428.1 hypothetical protein [Breznakia sp. PM6-1]MDF9835157.1 hypothetical protein [Breznakia sp. PF5-3]MDF9838318.1 hypothetical protein [Breznakia sp. PFB2-8]MDF9860334.1 hypothetical protein [Breznakia sp. PH5-24]
MINGFHNNSIEYLKILDFLENTKVKNIKTFGFSFDILKGVQHHEF